MRPGAIFTGVVFILLCLAGPLRAGIFIDITSESFRPIPIAVYDLMGSEKGKTISDILREDFTLSGVFEVVPKDSYIETPLPVFNPFNWRPLGVEVVVKGSVDEDERAVRASVYVYDVVEMRRVLQRRYTVQKDRVIVLAHRIAGDIYQSIIGREAVFTKTLSFVAQKGDKQSISLIDYTGKHLRDTGLREEIILAPNWSRDGWRLLYTAQKAHQWNLYYLDFKEGDKRLLYAARGVNIIGDFLATPEKCLITSSEAGSPDIYVYDLKTGKKKRLVGGPGIEISPRLSPDGRRIAFVSDRSGSPQVYIMNLDGTGLRRLTYMGNYNTSPTWSPDGKRIAYVSVVKDRSQIYLVDIDGRHPRALTSEGNNEDPDFSPDGGYIAFTSDRDGYRRVYVMLANGQNQRPITPERMEAFRPRWRPETK